MHTILTLTKASAKMFVRSRQALFFTLFMPLVIMVIFGMIGFDKPQHFDIGAVAAPIGKDSPFINQLGSISVFDVHFGTLDEELTQLREGNRVVVLEIPDSFLASEITEPQTLKTYVNEGQQAQAQAVISILNQFLDKANLVAAGAPTLFTLKQELINAQNLTYIDFLMPGLIAMAVMQMSIFSVAFLFVQYKEKGVLKRLLATPMQPAQFVAANVITRLVVSVVQAAIFIIVGILILKAHVLGSYFLMLLIVILGTLMFLGIGFSVSGISKTVDSVPAFANLVAFPMLFLGGVFFPLTSMPSWLQHIAKYLPLTFFSSALRDVATKGAGFIDVWHDLLAMLIWAAIFIAIAIYTFGFQEKESA